jgi:hypothetical protein
MIPGTFYEKQNHIGDYACDATVFYVNYSMEGTVGLGEQVTKSSGRNTKGLSTHEQFAKAALPCFPATSEDPFGSRAWQGNGGICKKPTQRYRDASGNHEPKTVWNDPEQYKIASGVVANMRVVGKVFVQPIKNCLG